MTDLKDKVVLVTGASRGIGYQAAKEAARRGAHVIAVARTVGGLEELDDEIQAAGGSTTLVPLDLRDGDGIDRLGAAIFERWGRLDGLVVECRACWASSRPVPHLEPKEFDQAFAINVTANYRLIRSLDLLLRQSEAGRARLRLVVLGAIGRAPSGASTPRPRRRSKRWSRVYAAEVANTPLKVNAFYPGAVRTAMRAKAVPGEDPDTLPRPEVVVPKLIDMVAPAFTENPDVLRLRDGRAEAALVADPRHQHLVDAAPVHVEHLEPPRRALERLADLRQVVSSSSTKPATVSYLASFGIGTPILSANSSTGIQPETR